MTPAFQIRAVTSTDAADMLAIYAPVVRTSPISFEHEPPSEESFTKRVVDISSQHPWLVAEVDGQIVGYAYGSLFRDRPAYRGTRETTVYVHDGYQRRGVARALMSALLDQLRQSGAHSVIAVITLPNAASVQLHQSLGFRHVGTFQEVGRKFDSWHDVGFYQLRW